MKAIVVHEFGEPGVLQLENVPDPIPSPGQVLVRMKAAGLNNFDAYIRSGKYAIKPALPYTPGSDGAGKVEAVGEGINNFKKGDRVYLAGAVTGTYAEFALAKESQVHPLPDKITFSQGAGLGTAYGAVYRALHQIARGVAGEILLVHGASGGVGIASVQLSNALGLTVLGTAGTPKGLELVKREGAQQVFNHTAPDYRDRILEATDGKGVNIIFEMHADLNLGHDLKLLAQKGRVVVVGTSGDVTISPRDLLSRWGAILGFTLWGITETEEREIHAGISAGLQNGTLRPVIGKEMPLGEAPLAHATIVAAGALGKSVLLI